MKIRLSLLSAVVAGSLLCSSSLLAQDQSMPPPTSDTAHYATPQGKLTVHSVQGPATPVTPPPSFEQLSNGGKSISEEQAAAYPPLANDFEFADRNRDKHISKSEYQQWLKQLQ
jgi:hypothetical protein